MRADRRLAVGSVLLATVIVALGLPVGQLLSLHRQVAGADGQLAALNRENAALRVQEQRVGTPAEIERVARTEYQLVLPGQQLFEILPGPNSGTGGDPGVQGLSGSRPVPPADSPGMQPDPGLTLPPGSGPAATSTATAPPRGPVPGFWRRFADTLEFWR